mmetsp:Transcript_26905/g.80195  ORF Transcript_26905/g.80195 Transcript_26905/m.80195 type:complete len:281 (+) Transcript_26905:402-1244(+)
MEQRGEDRREQGEEQDGEVQRHDRRKQHRDPGPEAQGREGAARAQDEVLRHPPRAHGRLRRDQRRWLAAAPGDVQGDLVHDPRAGGNHRGDYRDLLPRLQALPRRAAAQGAAVRPCRSPRKAVQRGGGGGRERRPEPGRLLPFHSVSPLRHVRRPAERGGLGGARAPAQRIHGLRHFRAGHRLRAHGVRLHLGRRQDLGPSLRRGGGWRGVVAAHARREHHPPVLRHVLRLEPALGHAMDPHVGEGPHTGLRHGDHDGPRHPRAGAVRLRSRLRLLLGRH